jgi:hypothetical protein
MQAIIIHKWHSHARRRLLFDMGLYLMLMLFFIVDLCLVGLTMGRSPLDATWVSDESANRFANDGARSLASALMEVAMALICVRDLWYGLVVLCHCLHYRDLGCLWLPL